MGKKLLLLLIVFRIVTVVHSNNISKTSLVVCFAKINLGGFCEGSVIVCRPSRDVIQRLS